MTSFRQPPKYSCTICGKTCRRKKQHFNHVMRGHNNSKARQQQLTQPAPTYIETMQPAQYIGREYTGNPIPEASIEKLQYEPQTSFTWHLYISDCNNCGADVLPQL